MASDPALRLAATSAMEAAHGVLAKHGYKCCGAAIVVEFKPETEDGVAQMGCWIVTTSEDQVPLVASTLSEASTQLARKAPKTPPPVN